MRILSIIGARYVLSAFMFVIPATLVGSTASADAASLFHDTASTAGLEYSQPAEVKRFRYVGIDRAALPERVRSGSAQPELDLPLFFDANFTGVVEEVQNISDGKSWIGSLKGEADSSFMVVSVGDVFMVHIASSGSVFEVSWVADGTYRIEELDHSKFRDHPKGSRLNGMLAPAPDEAAEYAEASDPDKPIDILVAFTDDARAAAGGTDQIKALIELAVLETNQSYSKSGIKTRLRLLHVEEFNYTESGDIDTEVSRFAGNGDGFLDDIHKLRKTYGADMMGLIVENGGGYCGVAKGIYPGASKAFQVTARNCATGYYSFGHEFGHLQGARHDTYVDQTNTPYAYGHGYTDWRAPSPWRTVMAYNNKCDSKGVNCVRKNYWSNKKKKFNNRPAGTNRTKNYKVLNNTDATVANYKKRIIDDDINSSFNNKAGRKGWKAKSGKWSSCKGKYYCSKGLPSTGAWATFKGRSTKGTFGDVTYSVRMKRTGKCETCANRMYIRGDSSAIALTNWPRPTYAFQYTNSGLCSVYEVTDTGTFIALKSWATCGALKNGWNKLTVVAVGKTIKFTINGVFVWSGSDDTLRVGKVGVGFYRDNTDPGKLSVDWATIQTTPTASATSDALPGDGPAQPQTVLAGGFDQSPH